MPAFTRGVVACIVFVTVLCLLLITFDTPDPDPPAAPAPAPSAPIVPHNHRDLLCAEVPCDLGRVVSFDTVHPATEGSE